MNQPSWTVKAGRWLQKNLFSSFWNTILTGVTVSIIVVILSSLIPWIFSQAQWQVVQENLRLLLVGRYPQSEIWRLWLSLGILFSVVGLSGLSLRLKSTQERALKALPVLWWLTFSGVLWLWGGGVRVA